MDIPFCPRKDGCIDIRVMDPVSYQAPAALAPFWHSLEFVTCLPVVRCTIGVNGTTHDARLMIDSGELSHLASSLPFACRLWLVTEGVGLSAWPVSGHRLQALPCRRGRHRPVIPRQSHQ